MVQPIQSWPSPPLIKSIVTTVEDKTFIVFVALSGTDVLGTVDLCAMSKRSASFKRLFVREDVRRRGIGAALVEECCKIARRQGLETMGITCRNEESLVRFYKRLGFIVGYEDADGELSMMKVL